MSSTTPLEKQLVETIRRKGVSLASLASATGVDRAALSRFVNGKGGLTSRNVGRLCEHLGLVLSTPGEAAGELPEYVKLGVCHRWLEGCDQGGSGAWSSYDPNKDTDSQDRLFARLAQERRRQREGLWTWALESGRTVEQLLADKAEWDRRTKANPAELRKIVDLNFEAEYVSRELAGVESPEWERLAEEAWTRVAPQFGFAADDRVVRFKFLDALRSFKGCGNDPRP